MAGHGMGTGIINLTILECKMFTEDYNEISK